MGVDGQVVAEAQRDEGLPRRVGKVFLGADDVRDPHRVVVDHAREMVEARAVGPLDHVVLLPLPGELDPAAYLVVDDERAFPGHQEPHDGRAALGGEAGGRGVVEGGEAAAREERPAGGLGGLPLLVDLRRGREIAVGVAGGEQPCGRRPIQLAPSRLEIRLVRTARAGALVPVDAQPAEPGEDRLERLLDIAGDVGVVDPQDELPAVPPRKEPVEEGRADASDVEVAGGARGEAGANGHGAVSGVAPPYRAVRRPSAPGGGDAGLTHRGRDSHAGRRLTQEVAFCTLWLRMPGSRSDVLLPGDRSRATRVGDVPWPRSRKSAPASSSSFPNSRPTCSPTS